MNDLRPRLRVATDGACSGNPGPAGWGWVDELGVGRAGSIPHGTNQVAELQALVEALRAHRDVVNLTIEIDSMYALNTYQQWMDGHARRGWVTSQGKPTSNRDIIEQLIAERNWRREANLPAVTFVKVKGHAGGRHPLNDAADKLAVEGSRAAKRGHSGPLAGAAA